MMNVATQPVTALQSRIAGVAAALAVGGVFLALIAGAGPKAADLDIWHEMALARELLTRGNLPSVDSFAYTPTVFPVIHHEWGTGVVLYSIASAFGGAGILALSYMVLFTAVVLAAISSIRAGAELHIVFLASPFPILLLATGFSPFRAQAFSVLFFSILLYCLACDRRGHRSWMAFWIPLFVLWANLHGGCVLAIGALLLDIVERWLDGERPAHLLVLTSASVLALCCTPYGMHYYGYLLRAFTMHRPAINEWMPLWRQPATALVWVAVGVCVLCAAYVIVSLRRHATAGGAFILAALAVGAPLRVKLLDFFAVAFIAYFPALLNLTPGRGLIVRSRHWHQFWTATWFGATVMSVLLITHAPWWQLRVPGQPFGPNGTAYPVGPVAYLKQHRFAGNVFAPFESGAYISWNLYPAVRVAVDSRYEVAYPAFLVDEVFDFYYGGGRKWSDTLSKYATDVVIVPRPSVAASRMPLSGWRRCYRDPGYELYVRPGLALPVQEHRHEFWGTLP